MLMLGFLKYNNSEFPVLIHMLGTMHIAHSFLYDIFWIYILHTLVMCDVMSIGMRAPGQSMTFGHFFFYSIILKTLNVTLWSTFDIRML